jgi:hypothetical protein
MPEIHLEVLENTVSPPWIALEDAQHDRGSLEYRMKRAYSRLFQIFLYLGQFHDEEIATKFLVVSSSCCHLHRVHSIRSYRTLNKRL